MDQLIQALVETIRTEEAKLQEFLELLERQKRMLVSNENEAFEQSVARQEELMDEIRELEHRRVEQAASIAKDMKQDESEITLTRLVEMSLGNVSDELREVKKNVNTLVDRIHRANQVNQYLIKRSMNRVHRSIEFLIDGAEVEVTTYKSDGKLNGPHGRSVLVNRTM